MSEMQIEELADEVRKHDFPNDGQYNTSFNHLNGADQEMKASVLKQLARIAEEITI